MECLTNESYLHKKFDITNEYKHKKFGRCPEHKRKHIDIEDYSSSSNSNKENTSLSETNLMTKNMPAAKRKQTKSIFRPWEINSNAPACTKSTATQHPAGFCNPGIFQYHSNMARTYPAKERTPKEQDRRNRNTLACLINRRTQRAEEIILQQQYTQYKEQYAHVLQAQLRSAMYLRHLQQLALATTNVQHKVTPPQLYHQTHAQRYAQHQEQQQL